MDRHRDRQVFPVEVTAVAVRLVKLKYRRTLVMLRDKMAPNLHRLPLMVHHNMVMVRIYFKIIKYIIYEDKKKNENVI